MKKVVSYYNTLEKIFDYNERSTCKLICPISKGTISTQFEAESEKDFRAQVKAKLSLPKGDMVILTHTDEPCAIGFNSKKIIPFTKIGAFIRNSNTDLCQLSGRYGNQFGPVYVKQKLSISLNNPVHQDASEFETSSTNIMSSTQLCHPVVSSTLDLFTRDHIISFNILARQLVNYGLTFSYDWSRRKMINAMGLLAAKYRKTKIVAALQSTLSQARFSVSMFHPFLDKRLNCGMNISMQYVSKSLGLESKAAIKYKIDEGSNFKLIIASDQSLSSQFSIDYQNFLKMKFIARIARSAANIDKSFGGVFVLDISK